MIRKLWTIKDCKKRTKPYDLSEVGGPQPATSP